MEFKSDIDVAITEKTLKFPLIGEKKEQTWNLILCNEFNMTTDSHLFKTEPGNSRLPLYEGKMFHQFTHTWGQPKYWLDEKQARKAILGKSSDTHQTLDYQNYRLAFRDVAASTNERGMIMTILPRNVFCPHTVSLENVGLSGLSSQQRLYLLAVCNGFVIDYLLRMRITNHLSFFFIYNLPVPRLSEKDAAFKPIVERAARLICTTPEFDDLAKEVGARRAVPLQDADRARLRAELDGLVAHLYGLTEEEFAYILTTFPIVPAATKEAALQAYKDVGRGLIK